MDILAELQHKNNNIRTPVELINIVIYAILIQTVENELWVKKVNEITSNTK